MTIGSNIRKLRASQGLTQDQLAQRLYVTRQTVSNWERGTSQPNLEQLEAIAGALDVDIMTLLYGPKPRFQISKKQVLIAAGILLLAVALWGGSIFFFEPKIKEWYMRAYDLRGWYLYQCAYMTATILLTVLGGMGLLRGLAPIQLEKRTRKVCLIVGSVFVLVWLLGWIVLLGMVFAGVSLPYELFRLVAYMEQKSLMHIAIAFGGVFLFLAFCKPRKNNPEQEKAL